MAMKFIFIFLCFFSTSCVSVEAEDCVNVAYGKTTLTSLEIPLYYSRYAVNGRHDTFNFCFMSNKKQPPWWTVDLGGTYNIHYIYVVLPSKKNNCSSGLRNFTISLGNLCEGNTDILYSKCYYQEENSPLGSKLNITCSGNAQGRFVRLELGQRERLVLCEVEVYAHAATIDPQLPCLIEESSINNTLSSQHSSNDGVFSTSGLYSDQYSEIQPHRNEHLVSDANGGSAEPPTTYRVDTQTLTSTLALFSAVASPSNEDIVNRQLQQPTSDASFTYSSIESSTSNHDADILIRSTVQGTPNVIFSQLSVESSASGETAKDIFLSSSETLIQTSSFGKYNDLTPSLDLFTNTWLSHQSVRDYAFLSFKDDHVVDSATIALVNSRYSVHLSMATSTIEASESVVESSAVGEVNDGHSHLTHIDTVAMVNKTGYSLQPSMATLNIKPPDILKASSLVEVEDNIAEYSSEISPLNNVTSEVLFYTSMLSHSITSTMYISNAVSYTTTFNDYVPAIKEITGDYWNTDDVPLGNSKCWCRCRVNGVTLTVQMEENIKKLTLNPTNLSQQRRKKMSIPDYRVSAQSIGYVGIFTLVLVFGPHVLSDVFSIIRYVVLQIRDAAHQINGK